MFVLIVCCVGCGSFINLAMTGGGGRCAICPAGKPSVYGGVKIAVGAIQYPAWSIFALADLPLSLTIDTLALPYFLIRGD